MEILKPGIVYRRVKISQNTKHSTPNIDSSQIGYIPTLPCRLTTFLTTSKVPNQLCAKLRRSCPDRTDYTYARVMRTLTASLGVRQCATQRDATHRSCATEDLSQWERTYPAPPVSPFEVVVRGLATERGERRRRGHV